MVNVIFNQSEYEISQRKMELWDKYNKIILWGRQHPIRFAEQFLGLTFTDHQKYVFMSTWVSKYATWVMSRNSGKALSLDTPVYTPVSNKESGKWEAKTIGDLKVGDKIYTASGELTEVLFLKPIIIEDVYEVELEDGEIIECNGDHLWRVYDNEITLVEKSTCNLYENFKLKDNKGKTEYRYKIPSAKPINYPKNFIVLPIDPYLLGYYLGSEHIGDSNILAKKTLKEKLEELGVLQLKRIPEPYFFASIEDRLELLQGIMDAGGYINKRGYCKISQPIGRLLLLEDVSRLLSELGIKNRICCKKILCNGKDLDRYEICFLTDKTRPCFKLKRKYNRLQDTARSDTWKKTIIDIRKTDKKKSMRCIVVTDSSGLFLCGKKATVTHNSYLTAPYIMTRSILIPNHKTYIMSVTGGQSQETFKKMEDLAMGNIASVAGATSVFLNELVKEKNGGSGFTHGKDGYHCALYNSSEVFTLNSVAKNIVGIRSNLNVYDEAGKIAQDFFDLTRPFTTQDTNFITGSGINLDCYPLQPPNQILMCSSAEDVFTELWKAYKYGAQEMIMGNTEYFVCDINCKFSLHPTMGGNPYRPLVTQSTIDDALAKNEYRANREYFNIFDTSGGQDSLVSKITLLRNSYGYLPVFKNEGKKKYIIIYDPSSKRDNSVILVAELIRDPDKGYVCKIVNCVNFVERLKDGTKKVLQKPDQLERLKKLIVDYNGMAPDYENLERIVIDAGSGGGGFDLSQFILPGWTDDSGIRHVGIIDKSDKYHAEVIDRFPEARDILTLANFTKDKVKMYEATQDALHQGLIIFPKDQNGRGEMEMDRINEDGEKEFYYTRLSDDELRAITEIELLKLEAMAMQQTKNSANNKITWDLMPSKKLENYHDDRADTLAMLCDYLMKLRSRDKMGEYAPQKKDFSKLMPTGNRSGFNNPFGAGNNPFNGLGSNPFLK